MSATKVLEALNNISGLSDLVSDRIELSPARQGLATPYIAYELDGDDPVVDLNGTADITRQDWNIFICSESFIDAETIARLVIKQFPQQKSILYATFINSSSDYDDDTKVYTYEVNFKITYR